MEVLQRTANRGSISTATDTGYNIGNSMKLESDNSEYLHRTPSSTGSTSTWTASMWVKRTELGADQVGICARESGSTVDFWRFTSADKIRFHVYSTSPSAQIYYADTDAVFRDTAAWYHVVLTLDSTNADGSERLKLFVNGSGPMFLKNLWASRPFSVVSVIKPNLLGSLNLTITSLEVQKSTWSCFPGLGMSLVRIVI